MFRLSDMTQELLKDELNYDPSTGVFTRVSKAGMGNLLAPRVAGTITTNGYVSIHVRGKCYQAHRLAWLYMYGSWPGDDTDHINGVRHDNRIANLRDCTRAQNSQNTGMSKRNKSGKRGVSWSALHSKWRAQIALNGKVKHLGLFDTTDEASLAYLSAKSELHTFQPTPRT